MESVELVSAGIAGGLVVSVFVFSIIYIIKCKLKPWYEQFKYRGEDISGSWKTNIVYEGARDELIFHLHQRLNEITGNIVILKKYTSGQLVNRKKIALSGRYVSDHLMLIGVETGNAETHHSSFLLKKSACGKVFKGYSSWVLSDPSGLGMTSRHLKITR